MSHRTHSRSSIRTVALAAALATLLLAPACRRTSEGKIVADEKARAQAQAEAEKVQEATKEGLADAGEATKDAAAKVGEKLDAGVQATGEALDRASKQLEPRVADATLTARVKARLIADPEVSGLSIDVDSVNGIVTLNGRVATAAQRDEAVKLARLTEGVLGVNDLLQIVGGA